MKITGFTVWITKADRGPKFIWRNEIPGSLGDIPILAAETSGGAHWNMASWIEAGALDMSRINAHHKGGFAGSMKIAGLSQSYGMHAQVHGMGLENAQLCAAIPNNDYYEQLVINEDPHSEIV